MGRGLDVRSIGSDMLYKYSCTNAEAEEDDVVDLRPNFIAKNSYSLGGIYAIIGPIDKVDA